MSLPIHVDAYSGHRANERPTGFELDGTYYRIYALEDQWYSPSAHYFKVRAEAKRFILRYEEQQDEWTLQSAYDGKELFARSGVQVITVDPEVVRAAEKRVESCEQCHPDDAEWPFAAVLDAITGRAGNTDYLITEPARCPTCGSEITEHTLIELSPDDTND
jgi:hypothetical protein